MKDLPQIAKQYKSHGFVLLALANFSFPFPTRGDGASKRARLGSAKSRDKCRRDNVTKKKCKCNLFTHGALRSSQELVQKCPCIPKSNWNLEMLVFKEKGKPEYPEKNLRVSEKGEGVGKRNHFLCLTPPPSPQLVFELAHDFVPFTCFCK